MIKVRLNTLALRAEFILEEDTTLADFFQEKGIVPNNQKACLNGETIPTSHLSKTFAELGAKEETTNFLSLLKNDDNGNR